MKMCGVMLTEFLFQKDCFINFFKTLCLIISTEISSKLEKYLQNHPHLLFKFIKIHIIASTKPSQSLKIKAHGKALEHKLIRLAKFTLGLTKAATIFIYPQLCGKTLLKSGKWQKKQLQKINGN